MSIIILIQYCLHLCALLLGLPLLPGTLLLGLPLLPDTLLLALYLLVVALSAVQKTGV